MRGFGDLESVIMDLIWSHSVPVTVREIHTQLRDRREIAYTTVLTVMDNLHKKGWLGKAPLGRAHQYSAVVSREQYGAQLMREALDDSGDRAEALLQFVDRMSSDEAAAVRAALAAYERKMGAP